jgi:hypothetical protein
MTSLTETTRTRIQQLFAPDHHHVVARLLESECGNNLPFLEHADAQTLERYHLAALALSRGSLEGLREAIELAKLDWRDLLVAASKVELQDIHREGRVRRSRGRKQS